ETICLHPIGNSGEHSHNHAVTLHDQCADLHDESLTELEIPRCSEIAITSQQYLRGWFEQQHHNGVDLKVHTINKHAAKTSQTPAHRGPRQCSNDPSKH